jgi:hypothetical protein
VDYANLGKLVRAAHEFAGYIRHNTASLINYGERYRSGEPISSSIAESTVNVVISKRFGTVNLLRRDREQATDAASANITWPGRRTAGCH